ncbi:MAG: tRNA preQ1(34) S-adenosylmethionine ribosyltransferase-isomerase QueA [Anaerolineales bacterium]|jgi:S-adenosylmethionine:tRNA ribosyltransferase-isomerase|nr:tRNA preQ1(34) S-adenosylmethionine ribosyltransferase-isomerase QueA [Anaerolineales bacterium]
MDELHSLRTDDFDYHLPPKFVAQIPIEPRDSARMMVWQRDASEIAHRQVVDIGSYLNSGDAIALNDTRVFAGRLRANKSTGGRVELLLLRRMGARTWEAMVKGRGMGPGASVEIECGRLSAQVLADAGGSRRVVKFSRSISPILHDIGKIPLPPYVKNRLIEDERYQTVYGAVDGSAAAPTAGLHFTSQLLAELREKGVKIVMVTLHVGVDTFGPVVTEKVIDHPIHSEWCCLDETAAETINSVRNGGGRVVAVGTTTVRVLETAARAGDSEGVSPVCGYTDVFITPGHRFRAVDALLTNFHLPRSTLLMLVAAFLGANGRAEILNAYRIAMRTGYRFFSFGDAMLIL